MDGLGEQGRQRQGQRPESGKNLIKIPSYQEVFSSGAAALSASSSSTPPSYNPPLPTATAAAAASSSSSSSFSQAFSFLKSTEFYSPPTPPPQPSTAPRPLLAGPSTQAPQIKNAILVSNRQKGNPLLKHIRNARWAFTDIVPDYVVWQSSCALYISLEECGRYLETIKVFENKPADSIREHKDNDYLSRLTHALTSFRRVNKTDVVTLGSSFGSLSPIMDASMEELARCPGIVPDTPDREKASGQPSSTNDSTPDAAEKSGASKNKKGSDKKSALTATFAKYSEKIRSQGHDAATEAGEGTSSSTMEGDKTKQLDQ